MPIQALSVTSSFTRPPRSEWTGKSSARALRSISAISTAALASERPGASRSMTASARCTLNGSPPASAGPTAATLSWTSAADTAE